MRRTQSRANRSSHRTRSGLALVLAMGATGCGNLTAGGVGEAAVVMSGDAPEPTPQTMSATAPQPAIVGSNPAAGPVAPAALTGGPLGTDADADDPEGQFEADLSVFLVPAEGEPVRLTDGEVEVRLDLEGVEEPEIGSRQVTATTYTELRIVFTKIEVEVAAGLLIGGVEVTGPIDVDFGDLSLEVDRPLDLDIGDGERVELLIDLNSDSWLQAVDPVTLSVDAQVFADLLTIVVR